MNRALIAHTRSEQQLGLLNEGTEVASRNLERLLSTQFDGCRDWLSAVNHRSNPSEQLEQHLDQSLQLGCALFVAQVSAFTDAMQFVERAVAEQQRSLIHDLAEQPSPVREPIQRSMSVGACAYDSMSKATRQVANFASNRFAAATVSAYQQARGKLAESI